MLTLAFETSTRHGSLALLDAETGISAVDLDREQRTTESLLPACQRLLQQSDLALPDVELLAVSIGPGSFTGLRIGVVVAKTLAYSLRIPVVAVDSLQVVAKQAVDSSSPVGESVLAIADAQRNQLYCREYGIDAAPRDERPPLIRDVESWLAEAPRAALVGGEGLKRIESRVRDARPDLQLADPEQWRPRAETVGQLGAKAFAAGVRHDFWKLAPLYIRASAAEEKLAQKPTS